MEDRVMVYRGADQPDMSVINPESDVWQHIKVYLFMTNLLETSLSTFRYRWNTCRKTGLSGTLQSVWMAVWLLLLVGEGLSIIVLRQEGGSYLVMATRSKPSWSEEAFYGFIMSLLPRSRCREPFR